MVSDCAICGKDLDDTAKWDEDGQQWVCPECRDNRDHL